MKWLYLTAINKQDFNYRQEQPQQTHIEELPCAVIELMNLLIVASCSHKHLLKFNLNHHTRIPCRLQRWTAFVHHEEAFAGVSKCSWSCLSQVSQSGHSQHVHVHGGHLQDVQQWGPCSGVPHGSWQSWEGHLASVAAAAPSGFSFAMCVACVLFGFCW